jgi:beta-lactamase regulating signal transducer with metallopeptidase domain
LFFQKLVESRSLEPHVLLDIGLRSAYLRRRNAHQEIWLTFTANSRSSSSATTTSSNTFSSASSSAASSSQAPAPHKSGLSPGAAGAIGAVVALLVLAIAAGIYIFLRRRRQRTAASSDHPREEVKPGPHELDTKDVPVKDAQVYKFSAKPVEGPPQGHSNKEEILRAQELEPK